MTTPTYTEILARLEAVRTVADLQAYADWLYASDALDESETTRTVGSRGALAPWSTPSAAEWVEDDGDDITVRLASGEYARWSNADRAWSETDEPDEDEDEETMTMTNETLTKLAKRLATIEGVDEANAWTRVAGKERIYVELENKNGRGAETGRVQVAADGEIVTRNLDFMGARTRNFHRDNETVEQIIAMTSAIMAETEGDV